MDADQVSNELKAMEELQTVELFSGAKVFSSLAHALGYKTLTVDNDGGSEPDLIADVTALDASTLPKNPLIAWAAPPASSFNQQDTDAHWDQYGSPLSPAAERGMAALRATLRVFSTIQPKWWFIESPYGPLRHFTLMTGFNRGYPTRNRITIDHADYSDRPTFRTDIWTNAFWWQPRQEALSRIARRPANTKVQSSRGADTRLPASAIAEMLDQLDEYQKRARSLDEFRPGQTN